MHIGVLTHNYPRFPGDFSGTFVEALCQEFANQGQQVTVWAPFDSAYAPTSGQLHNLPISNPDLRLYRYAYPDRLHTLGYMRSMQSDLSLKLSNYFLSPLFFAAGIAKVMVDCKRLRPDLLHAHWLLPNGFIAAVVARRLHIPLAISVPGSDAQVANANPLFRAMARFALRQADLLTANSEELRDAVLKVAEQGDKVTGWQGDRVAAQKFDLILYGTDPTALKPDPTGVAQLRKLLIIQSPNLLISQAPVLLLCVGRMVYKKGFDYLLRALAEPELRQRNVLAVMIGNGDQKEEWQALAQHLGITDRVRWVGNVPKTEIGVYYNACDILLNPSVSKPADGLNVCVLDAMSCGKPVVGSNVAGNALAIVDGETGLIVPEQNASALAKALAKLVDDEELRLRMGQAARRRIETELGWPPLAKRYLAHFERIRSGG